MMQPPLSNIVMFACVRRYHLCVLKVAPAQVILGCLPPSMRFLCQEVLELTKSTPAIGSSDFTQLREEVQSLPRQSDLQQLRQVGS